MALKPTIYKARISLNDLDNDRYESLNLTLALHPSETLERMMARLLAFCINHQEFLQFTKGLSTPDEPDIVATAYDDETLVWIDVGEPSAERVKKACRKASKVLIYTFNEKSDTWWSGEQKKMAPLAAKVFQFRWQDMQALCALADRTMEMSLTLTGFSAFVALGNGEQSVEWTQLQ